MTSKLADTKVCVVMMVFQWLSWATGYTKAASEVKTLDTFYHTLQNEPDRAYYG